MRCAIFAGGKRAFGLDCGARDLDHLAALKEPVQIEVRGYGRFFAFALEASNRRVDRSQVNVRLG